MTIEKIVEYVYHTPYNTNKAILIEMLEQLIISHGGKLDGEETPGIQIIYDGGIEK